MFFLRSKFFSGICRSYDVEIWGESEVVARKWGLEERFKKGGLSGKKNWKEKG